MHAHAKTKQNRKIANYPFTTIVPNLGVCDLGEGAGLVLCDIPGLIEGAAGGAGMVSSTSVNWYRIAAKLQR